MRGATSFLFCKFPTTPISTHAPRAGSDHTLNLDWIVRKIFQPTLPVRGATTASEKRVGVSRISTHAPRAGSDYSSLIGRSFHSDFNPRSPCGERHRKRRCSAAGLIFQPTLPVRGATQYQIRLARCIFNFNPRSPCGERLPLSLIPFCPKLFQPTLPVRGATPVRPHLPQVRVISTHAPRAGSDFT